MSLSGSVEDLPLLEILQVVSFCQKTGHLTVRADAGEAAVVFDSGRVVAGYAWDVAPLPPGDPAPGAAREHAVRERVAAILEKLVRLRSGDFAFHLSQEVPTALGGRDLSGEMLPGGINPEELMLDLAKKLDEDRRDAAAVLEASFAAPVEESDLGLEELLEFDPDEPETGTGGSGATQSPQFKEGSNSPVAVRFPSKIPPGEPQAVRPPSRTPLETPQAQGPRREETGPAGRAAPASAPPTGPRVLVVDDEPEVRRVLRERLGATSYRVSEASDPLEARAAMEELAADAGPFLLVVDVGLPSQASASFRGGFDVLRYASGVKAAPPVLLMAETIDEKLRTRARRAGASLLAWKPGLSKLDPLQYEADLRAFGDKLARDLLPRLAGRSAAPRPRAAPRPAGLQPVRLPIAQAPPAGEAAAAARRAAVDAALVELRSHPDPDMVAFLLLRAARAFFPRVVLFLVRDERLRGLGGAGPVANGSSLDLLARELQVPLEAPSPFADAVALGKPWSGALPEGGPLRAMVDRMGGLGATAAAILPVRAQQETIAVVYGDAPGGAPLPELDALVAFTDAAGRALDDALLERRSPPKLAC